MRSKRTHVLGIAAVLTVIAVGLYQLRNGIENGQQVTNHPHEGDAPA
jgi:hypothetical protein